MQKSTLLLFIIHLSCTLLAISIPLVCFSFKQNAHGFMLRSETFPICKLCLWMHQPNRGACRWWDPHCLQKKNVLLWMIHLVSLIFLLFLSVFHLPLSPPPLFSSSPGFYITLHFPFSLSARDCFPERLPSMLRLIFLFLSRLRSSWKSSVTLWLVLADVSMKAHFHWLAWASPSLVSTSRWVSSLLFPTSMMGIASTLPFMASTCKGKEKQMDSLCSGWWMLIIKITKNIELLGIFNAILENTSLKIKELVIESCSVTDCSKLMKPVQYK